MGGAFQKSIKSLETIATECALEHLNGESLRLAVQIIRYLHRAPENIVVEYALSWDSYRFAVYGFSGANITLMLSFDGLEHLMRFVEATSAWEAKWVLHESMNFSPPILVEQTEDVDVSSEEYRRGGYRLRCFMCDEELQLPDEHLRAVTCDKFSVAVPLWTHC